MDKLTSIESELTIPEKVSIAFESLVRMDEDEVKRIHSTCERRTYIAHDLNFSERLSKVKFVVMALGRLFWQASALQYIIDARSDILKNEELFEIPYKRISAIIRTVREMSEIHGVKFESICELAGIPTDDFFITFYENIKPDEAELEEYLSLVQF